MASTSSPSTDAAPVKMRKRTFVEMQPYILAYGAGISLFSPLATIYQLAKLNPQVPVPVGRMVTLAGAIFPIQTVMKAIQMNASTPIKESLNPWAAFAVVGILQGGVYGQANIYFSQKLGLNKKVDLRGLFRGAGFAACRDVVSQGIPFMCSALTKKYIFDKILPVDESTGPVTKFVNYWGSVLSTSIVSTYLSQPFMNLQITMQTNPELNHLTTISHAWKQNGISLLYKGAEARVGLLIVVNILNELLLKPAWSGVPVEE